MAETRELDRHHFTVAAVLLSLIPVIGMATLKVARAPATQAVAHAAAFPPRSPHSSYSLFEQVPQSAGVVTRRILTKRMVYAADVNGDGKSDLIALTEEHDEAHKGDSSGVTIRYLAFDGTNGSMLWHTDDLGSVDGKTQAWVVGEQLLFADPHGKLMSYDLLTGIQQWKTDLSSRVTAFCEPAQPGAVRIVTKDASLMADLKTGKAKPVKNQACVPFASHEPPPQTFEDRVDHRAPAGVVAVICGAVKDSGRTVTPDPCGPLAQIDFRGLDAIQADSLWEMASGFLVLGFSKSTERTPMVGFLRDAKIAWKSEVRDQPTLQAESGPPKRVFLEDGVLYVAYGTGAGHPAFATAFAIESGARKWHATLPASGESVDSVVVKEGVVFVGVHNVEVALSAVTGNVLFTAGDGD